MGSTGRSGPETYVYPPIDRVIFGTGAVDRLRDEIERMQLRRVLIVTTPSIATRTPLLDRVRHLLQDRSIGVFSGVRQHVPGSAVQALLDRARDEVDGIVSLGGGSVIDTAKAAAFTLAETARATVTHIALPTTLSAAEFSPFFGVTDDVTLAKTSHTVANSAARVIVLDPELTAYTPEWLWLSSGVRALDHAVETVYAPNHQIAADVPALEAIRLLFRHLEASRDAVAVGDRHHCQIAAWLSFFAVANVSLGPSHMLGRQIGPRYSVPHGYTSAVLLPAVMAHLLPRTGDRQDLIAGAIRGGLGTGGPQAGSEAGQAVYDLVGRLGLPHRLRDLSVPREDLQSIAGGRDDLVQILQAAW